VHLVSIFAHFSTNLPNCGYVFCLLCERCSILIRETAAHPHPDLLVPEGKRQRVSYPDYLRGFWGALARAEEKGGCIVLPEPHVWSPDHGRKIFVRACYQALADAILRDAGLLAPAESSVVALRTGTHYWTILGNPGSGVMLLGYSSTYLQCRHREDGVHILLDVAAAADSHSDGRRAADGWQDRLLRFYQRKNTHTF
jgi:hypothetical protein